MRTIDEYEREEQGTAVDDEGRTARAVRMVSNEISIIVFTFPTSLAHHFAGALSLMA